MIPETGNRRLIRTISITQGLSKPTGFRIFLKGNINHAYLRVTQYL